MTILCLVLLLVLIHGYSQTKELVIKNRISGKEVVFHDGQNIKVYCYNKSIAKGQLKIIDCSNIEIDNYVNSGETSNIIKNIFSINSIEAINIKSLTARSIGSIITGVGSLTAIVGIGNVINANSHQGDIGSNFYTNIGIFEIIGGGFISLAGISILNNGKKGDRDNWDFIVRIK